MPDKYLIIPSNVARSVCEVKSPNGRIDFYVWTSPDKGPKASPISMSFSRQPQEVQDSVIKNFSDRFSQDKEAQDKMDWPSFEVLVPTLMEKMCSQMRTRIENNEFSSAREADEAVINILGASGLVIHSDEYHAISDALCDLAGQSFPGEWIDQRQGA